MGDLFYRKVITVFCLCICLLSAWVHFFSDLDLKIQDIFYQNKKWIIDPNDQLFYFLFYDLPKISVVAFAIIALIVVILQRTKVIRLSETKTIGLISFVFCIALFPLFINILKDIFRQPCPRDMIQYGGTYAGTLLEYLKEHGPLRCFPGAHAAAPFSVLGFMYFFKDKYNQALFVLVLIPMASLVSSYQVLRGVHFVSDTIFTAFSAWLFAEFSYFMAKKISFYARFRFDA